MICEKCQTTLPDGAVACWKCGTAFAAPATEAAMERPQPDILFMLFTFLFAAVLFVCAGWTIPFTLWGKINSLAMDYPQWAGQIGVVSGVSFIISTIGFLGGAWWGVYKFITRVAAGDK